MRFCFQSYLFMEIITLHPKVACFCLLHERKTRQCLLWTLTFRHTLNRLHLVQVSYFHSRQLTSENPSLPFSNLSFSGCILELRLQVCIFMLSTQSTSRVFNHDDFFFCHTRFPSHSILELSSVMFKFFIWWKPRKYVQLCLVFACKENTKDAKVLPSFVVDLLRAI